MWMLPLYLHVNQNLIMMMICLPAEGSADQPASPYSLGPVVQSVVSLTSSLRVISLTVLADSIYNILIFFAEKM